jgi:hypothetical protein
VSRLYVGVSFGGVAFIVWRLISVIIICMIRIYHPNTRAILVNNRMASGWC